MIGWLVAGAILGAAVVTALDIFWDEIANWLNHTAADAVERALGYKARKNMQKAVSRVTRIRDKIHNRTQIYTKRNMSDPHITKVTIESEAPAYEQDEEVLEELERQNELVNEFSFND